MSIFSRTSGTEHSLRIYAPAKINLHLEVLGLRTDGFHELAMVMQSIDLADFLEMTSNKNGHIKLTVDDPSLSSGDENLIIKAARLLRERSGLKDVGATIYLQKNIPIGAGLAGGSSDGAATLFGLNSLWGLGFTRTELSALAAELGSDIPFCLEGGTQLCFGRGEKLEAVKDNISSMALILVKDPLISVSTPWAYGRSKEMNGANYLKSEPEFERSRQQLREEDWLRSLNRSVPPPLRNDLQQVVAPETPAVQNALMLLSELPGSLGVAMSGSGPSCFALYASQKEAKAVLDENRVRLYSSGLESWCCSFQSQGVTYEP